MIEQKSSLSMQQYLLEKIINYKEQHNEVWKPSDLLKIQVNRYRMKFGESIHP